MSVFRRTFTHVGVCLLYNVTFGNVSCVHRAVWLSVSLSPKQRIPYLGPIYGGLREGVSIYIQGSVPEDITRSVRET